MNMFQPYEYYAVLMNFINKLRNYYSPNTYCFTYRILLYLYNLHCYLFETNRLNLSFITLSSQRANLLINVVADHTQIVTASPPSQWSTGKCWIVKSSMIYKARGPVYRPVTRPAVALCDSLWIVLQPYERKFIKLKIYTANSDKVNGEKYEQKCLSLT